MLRVDNQPKMTLTFDGVGQKSIGCFNSISTIYVYSLKHVGTIILKSLNGNEKCDADSDAADGQSDL